MTREELILEIRRFDRNGFKGSLKNRLRWLGQLYRIVYWQRVHKIAAL